MASDNENKLGTLVIDQNGQEFEIEIQQGNCLAVFIYVGVEDGQKFYQLYSFFADAAHLGRIIKAAGRPFCDTVKSLRLNMRYKECYHLLRRLVKYYTVECYYE